MDKIPDKIPDDQRATQFFITARVFEIVTIYVIICGKTARNKRGPFYLTETGKEQVRASVKKNLRHVLTDLKPEFFYSAPKLYAEQTILEFATMLSSGVNGKGIEPAEGLDISSKDELVVYPSLWKVVKQSAQRSGVKIHWYEPRWLWRKKIRDRHWLLAGGKEVGHFKDRTEEALVDIVRRIALLRLSNEGVGVIAARADFFNWLSFNRNKVPPPKYGDIIEYKFIAEGSDAKTIECIDVNYLPA
jgi:broad specificity phosphatase PhoE